MNTFNYWLDNLVSSCMPDGMDRLKDTLGRGSFRATLLVGRYLNLGTYPVQP